MKIDRFETERLIIRLWQESDKVPFAQLNADPEVVKYFPSALNRSKSDSLIESLMNCYEQNGYCPWAVELKDTHEFIGMIGLWATSSKMPFAPCVEVGFRLAQKFWRKGYAFEGAKASIELGFNEFKLKEIKAIAAAENFKSIGALKKLGMNRIPDADFAHPSFLENSEFKNHEVYILNNNVISQ